MTYSDDFTLPTELLEQISEQGLEYLPELIRILVNTAMQAERQKHLGAELYERSPERRGYANGYKAKTVKTRVGEITFDVPQVRDGSFYPDALEKGLRSERALTMTLAEMYVQGVSTRKVAAITEQLCGTLDGSQPGNGSTGRSPFRLAGAAAGDMPVCLPGCPLREGAPGRAGAGCGRAAGRRCVSGWVSPDPGCFRGAQRG